MIAYLDATAIRAAVSIWAPIVDAADGALEALATGSAVSPLRTAVDLDGGTLLVMPGRLAAEPSATVKLISVMPQHDPSIQGIAAVFDATTGTPAALLDGAALTAVRTAAISAAGARRITETASVLALLGSGAQAPWQARALASVFPLERILVWSPARRHRENLAETLGDELGIDVRAAAEPGAATRNADLVVCATSADKPFLHVDMLATRPVTVIAIGSYRPDMGEVGVSVFREAGIVYADDVPAVLHEAGDVRAAIEEGAISPPDVYPIGAADRPEPRAIRLLKTVGSAAEDAAVAPALIKVVGQNRSARNTLEM